MFEELTTMLEEETVKLASKNQQLWQRIQRDTSTQDQELTTKKPFRFRKKLTS